ncbi:hypothetical protein PUR71_09390 [Streptomyces sp. SP17BM10]|uniref:hypothetical protein n=1 Tax=Streptomyces sp. SP17BM10 TaxID=3002530 RepID=UPI002E7668B6|nr:hypothetical protein [Streptomyces sp. SP17BM10]MEE1783127.1 hypothetical protein [Streptomyces sp. SP17BM10]
MEATLAALAPQLQLSRPGPLVPVLPALRDLLPERGLRPGAVVSVTGGGTALLLALAAAASSTGTWCAALGFDGLGLLAAAELGVDLSHLVVVEDPGEHWAETALALADGFGLLLLRGTPPGPLRERLATVARRSGCAVVVSGDWPGARVRLRVVSRAWTGLGAGRGRLRARRMSVSAGGRGAAARERRMELWLPDTQGAVRAAGPAVSGAGADRAAPAGRGPLAVV